MKKIINYLYNKFDDFRFYCLLYLFYLITFFDNQYSKLTKKNQ